MYKYPSDFETRSQALRRGHNSCYNNIYISTYDLGWHSVDLGESQTVNRRKREERERGGLRKREKERESSHTSQWRRKGGVCYK